MRIAYGTHQFEVGECEYSHSATTVMTDAQTPERRRHRWEFQNCIVADGAAAIASRMAAIKAALALNGKDIKILDDSGNTLEGSLLSANCIGGVRVVEGPSFPTNVNAVYVTFMPYTFALEGDERISAADVATLLSSFTETLEREGGGPKFGYIESNRGLPHAQQLRQATVYRYTQAGRAVGLFSRPTPPNALWPSYLAEAPRVRYVSPNRFGPQGSLDFRNFEVSWSYRFESDVPLSGAPNTWGVTYIT